jgi:hypothetical protein
MASSIHGEWNERMTRMEVFSCVWTDTDLFFVLHIYLLSPFSIVNLPGIV